VNSNHLLAVEIQQCSLEYSYIHDGKAGISTAFEICEKSEICLKVPRRLGARSVELLILCDNLSYVIKTITGEWNGLSGCFDEYIFEIPSEQLGTGLYFIRPIIHTLGGVFFGHRFADKIYLSSADSTDGHLQLTIYNQKYVQPEKIRGGVIYHVFVDRFMRGGSREIPDGAKVIPGTWKCIPEYPEYPGAPLYNNCFYGGTLWGIIKKLDYIKSFGTSAIYLSPIFKAYSNHKYDTGDYMTIDPIFGGENAFRALVNACRERDIEIILDGVFNHTGSDSLYFNRFGRYNSIGAYQSKKSPYFEWFDFQSYPTKYTCWWGIDILPRINPDIPSCCDYFVGDDGVIDKYSNMGIYGFRLDVADELSDNFISKIKTRLATKGKESILYGEVWEDASNKISYGKRRKYYQGGELDGVMNYPVRTGIIDFLLGFGYEKLAYALGDVTNNAPHPVLHNQMNLLGTHDTERILTILGNENIDGKSNAELSVLHMKAESRERAINRLILAYTILSTIPGIPTIFYGDEAGLEGYRDPFNRMPFPWGKEEQRLVDHYRTMGNIRNNNDIYKAGDFKINYLDNDLLIFERYNEEYSYITIINNSDKDLVASFEELAHDLITDISADKFNVRAYSGHIFKTKRKTTIEI
jgi:glycosidase